MNNFKNKKILITGATGGIGGVHLEAEKTFDISSDLNELSKTTMFVVCSGQHTFNVSHFMQTKHSDIVNWNKMKGKCVWNTFYLHSALDGQLYEIESDLVLYN